MPEAAYKSDSFAVPDGPDSGELVYYSIPAREGSTMTIVDAPVSCSWSVPELLFEGKDGTLKSRLFRARYYDPKAGRFTRLDPFAGNINDPLSLHKYAYAHGNPISGIDPSGRVTLLSLAIGTGIRGILIGAVSGAVISEGFYFIGTPIDQWSVTGALSSIAAGAALGALGATVVGGAFFALQGLYQGIQVWRDPNASALQKGLASAGILLSVASAGALKGQVRGQFDEWVRVYSKLPLRAHVQTDLNSIRQAFSSGQDSINFGKITIGFANKKGSAGFVVGGIDDAIFLTDEAFKYGDDFLMKTILEENIHLDRLRRGLVDSRVAHAGQHAAILAEERMVGHLVDDIFKIGRERFWW